MDEVLVDFVGGVCRVWNIPRSLLDEQRVPGEWCIIPALSKALGCKKLSSLQRVLSGMTVRERLLFLVKYARAHAMKRRAKAEEKKR